MHLIDKEPKASSFATSTPPAKKGSKLTALKNKITSKVGAAIAAPYVAVKKSQMRQSDKDYKWLKEYNDKRKSGIAEGPKERAILNGYKDKYSK